MNIETVFNCTFMLSWMIRHITWNFYSSSEFRSIKSFSLERLIKYVLQCTYTYHFLNILAWLSYCSFTWGPDRGWNEKEVKYVWLGCRQLICWPDSMGHKQTVQKTTGNDLLIAALFVCSRVALTTPLESCMDCTVSYVNTDWPSLFSEENVKI